jgi:hypothetical protein
MGENMNQKEVIPRWRAKGAINLAEKIHEIRRKFDKLLPIFDPNKLGSSKDHVNNLFLAIHLLGVQHDDIMCRLFPYNFSRKASTWYFILLARSITNWDRFERLFMREFGERKTITSLHNELRDIIMDKRERVKEFNQRFFNVLIKFPHYVSLAHSLTIEYYTAALTPSIGMFSKRSQRNTLALKFDEVETMEIELSAYEKHPHYEETKSTGKKPLLLTKPPDRESKDIDNVVKMVKKLSNEVVDLKNNVGEGSSKLQNFGPCFKKPDNPPQLLEPPYMDFNLDSFSNDNFFSYHQKNHPE